MVSEKELRDKLHILIPPHKLPHHLGGTDESYKSEVRIDFIPENSSISIDSDRRIRFYKDLEAANKLGIWYG